MAKTDLFGKLIKNTYFLYAIILISLSYLFFVLSKRDYLTILIFTLISLITSFFSKNMIVIFRYTYSNSQCLR
jgi:hypothetical protein